MSMRSISVLTKIAAMAVMIAASAAVGQTWNFGYWTNVNSVTATLIGGTLTISGSGAMADTQNPYQPWYDLKNSITSVVIEEGVTTIGSYAFSGCTGLTSIEIPSSVTSIGGGAFDGCTGLTSIEIPNSVTTIGTNAFYGCTGLTSIEIPNSVAEIGMGAFEGCASLTSINVATNNAYYSSENGILFNKTQTLLIQCPARKQGIYTISNSVTEIGGGAFSGCIGLTSITIPNSVTKIGDGVNQGRGVFSGCTGLTSITIPNSVTEIGDYAFEDCANLTSITIGNSVTTIGASAFVSCKGLTSITIPNSMTEIGDWAFAGCTGLMSVTINGVTSIGDNAFNNCTSLTSVMIGNDVTSIGQAFTGCASLTSINVATNNAYYSSENGVLFNKTQTLLIKYPARKQGTYTIPNSVTEIGDYAGIGQASVIILNPNPPAVGSNALAINGCLYVPESSIEAYRSAQGWSSFSCIGNVEQTTWDCGEIPGTVTATLSESGLLTISGAGPMNVYSSFYSSNPAPWYDRINNVVIEGGVTSIGDNAFLGCTDLTLITIPNSVTSIGDGAFRECTGLSSITIPNGVTGINRQTFDGCTGLTSIEIPNSVGYISDYAFRGCTSLKSIDIPNSVGYIGYVAFSGCTSLKSIEIPNGVMYIHSGTFDGCTGLTSITIPNGVTSIGCRFDECTSLTSINVAINNAHYSSIDGVLFNKDQDILIRYPQGKQGASYTIPNSVTEIEFGAFSGCSGLTSITIPNSVTSIGYGAFHAFTGLTSIDIPSSVTSIGVGAFYGCTGLTSIEIPNSVTSIGDYTFYACTNLTSITIPNSVTAIGDYAFFACTNLTSITSLNLIPPTINSSAFVYVNKATACLYVPENVIADYERADYWNEFECIRAASVYTVTFNSQNGSHVDPQYVLTTGDKALKPADPTRMDYSFSGWYKESAYITAWDFDEDVVVGDITLYAKWTPIPYTISYTLNGGIVSSANPTSYNIETPAFTLTNPTRAGYTFDGWTGTNGTIPQTLVSIPHGSIGNRNYTAQWTLIPIINAAPPTITAQPLGGTVTVGTTHPLSVSASVSIGMLSYQWYHNTTASSVGGTVIAGATSVTYTPSTATVGTFYYYVVITNTDNSVNGEKTATVTSNVAAVAVGATSVLSPDRTIPNAVPEPDAAVVAPVSVSAFEMTAGPNPVRRSDGVVNVFVTGKRIDKGELTIYDATGNVIRKINIRDNAILGNIERRVVGNWDLKDAKGKAVSEGAYLLRGSVKTVDGRREKVSVMIGVR